MVQATFSFYNLTVWRSDAIETRCMTAEERRLIWDKFWTNGLYYLSKRDGARLYTIQNILNNINENIQSILRSSSSQMITASTADLPSTTIRMAIAVVGILPVVIAYPFFQKYFVKGITLGGVKE